MSTIKPFENDPDYIQQEIGWLAARTSRLAAEQALREAEHDINSTGIRVGRRHKPIAGEEARRVATICRAKEEKLRGDIDGRIEAARKAGVVLGLDKLCDEHDLTPYERLALLLAVVPPLGEKFVEEVLGKLDTYLVTSPTVEMAMLLTESQSVEDRLTIRAMSDSAEVPLIKHGLVSMDYHTREASPADLPGAQFMITESAFRALLGLSG